MEDKKVLLIYPTPITEAPIHFGIIAALLEQKGFETRIIVNTFKKPLQPRDFVNYARNNLCKRAMISMMTIDVLMVYDIVRVLKRADIEVVIAGPHPTDCPEECLNHFVDIVVRNELEGTLMDIMDYWEGKKELKDILGISYKEGNEIIHNPSRPRIDLDWLPNPKLDIFNQELFKEKDGLIKGFHRLFTSRGCPGRCTFCDHKVYEQTMKYHPIEKIMEYIKMVVEKYGITTFSIADDCFTLDHKRVYKFCEEIKKIKPKITFRVNSRANLVNLELLKTLKEAGCHSIAFGIESNDPETLIKVKKGILPKQNINAVKMAHGVGLEVYACLMTGFPWETTKHIQNQIDYIHEVWNDVSLFQVAGSLTPFPGTEIYREYAKQYGFENYWLKPEYQDFGTQIYQNALNPYRVSTFYQRYLFDDTYIQEDKFFKYTPEYKKKIKEFVFEVGRHNLEFMFPNQKLKQKWILFLSKLSMRLYEKYPKLEKNVGGLLFELFHSKDRRAGIEKRRDKRRGFVKHYDNPN